MQGSVAVVLTTVCRSRIADQTAVGTFAERAALAVPRMGPIGDDMVANWRDVLAQAHRSLSGAVM